MSGVTLDSLNPKYRDQAVAQMVRKQPEPKVKKRLRQRTDKRSALEDRFGEWLKGVEIYRHIHEQFPLRIGSGCNYYLDFLTAVRNPAVGMVHGYEIKGPYARAAGIIKLKAAASLYPWIAFSLVSWINGEWVFEDVRP